MDQIIHIDTNTHVSVTLLGQIEIKIDNKLFHIARSYKLTNLLIYLFLHKNESIARLDAAAKLYPEKDEKTGLRNLRFLLYELNRMCPGLIEKNKKALRLTPDTSITVDAVTIKNLYKQAQTNKLPVKNRLDLLHEAIEMYGGELARGIETEWISSYKRYYHDLFRNILQLTAELELKENNYDRALHITSLWEMHDDYSIRLYSMILRILRESQDFVQLRKTYNEFSLALQKEGYDEIPWELQQYVQSYEYSAADSITEKKNQVHAVQTDGLPLIGREKELNILSEIIEAYHEGSRSKLCVVFLEGDAGSGKSKIAAEIIKKARLRKFIVLTSECFDSDSVNSIALLEKLILQNIDMLDIDIIKKNLSPALAAQLCSIIPELAYYFPDLEELPNIETRDQKQRIADSIAGFFKAIMEETGIRILVVIENLQRVSLDTLSIIGRGLPVLRNLPFIVLGCIRSGELNQRPQLASRILSLSDSYDTSRISVKPLEYAAALQLISSVLQNDAIDSKSSDYIYTKSRGNPLFLLKTMELLYNKNLLVFTRNRWVLKEAVLVKVASIHDDIAGILEEKLKYLSKRSIIMLKYAAIAGSIFDAQFLSIITGIPFQDVRRKLADLVNWNILRAEGEHYTFFHDTLHEQVLLLKKIAEKTEYREYTMLGYSFYALCISMNTKKESFKRAYSLSENLIGKDTHLYTYRFVLINHYKIAMITNNKTAAYQALDEIHKLIERSTEVQNSKEWKEAYLNNLPYCREILDEWQKYTKLIEEGCIAVKLPSAVASKSGPVNEKNLIQVRLTLKHPLDSEIRNNTIRRQFTIIRIMKEAANQNATLSTYKIAELVGCSKNTVLSDLKTIKEKNINIETRGS